MKYSLYLFSLVAATALFAGEKQLLNLADIPYQERMNVPIQRVWPQNPGDAAVCLWPDDKDAVLSYTIDDNCVMNVDWWLKEAAQRDMKLTWFLITDRVGKTNPKMNGDWEKWQAVYDAGHSIESHSMNHLADVSKGNWKGIEWEYADSFKQIDENTTAQPSAIAYPGGGHIKKNDPSVAKKYYAAGRGGKPFLNGARGLNYMSISAMSRPNIGDRPKADYCDTTRLIDPEDEKYRGWGVFIYHYINGEKMHKVREQMDFYYNNRDKFWAASFSDAAKYAQSRDTSTIETVQNDSNRIVLNLTDWMKDDVYTYPLTVKVRLPDGWYSFRAKQGDGPELTTRVVEREGVKYGYVDIVPDGGQTILIPG